MDMSLLQVANAIGTSVIRLAPLHWTATTLAHAPKVQHYTAVLVDGRLNRPIPLFITFKPDGHIIIGFDDTSIGTISPELALTLINHDGTRVD